MASKDITKIVLAGTAVCGILVLFYLYKKRSKYQGNVSTENISKAKLQDVSNINTTETQKQQEPGKSASAGKSTESKIPQKIQTKPQNVKSASETSQSVTPKILPVQDDQKASGESVLKDNSAVTAKAELGTKLESETTNSKKQSAQPTNQQTQIPTEQPTTQQQPPSQQQPVQPKQAQQQVSASVQPKQAQQQVSASVQPEQAQQLSASVQPEQSPASVQPEQSPASVQPEQSPASVQPEQSKPQQLIAPEQSQQNTEQPSPVNEQPKQNEEDVVRSQTSIVLSPKPEDTSTVLQNGTEPAKPALDVESITKAIQLAKNSPASIDKESIDIIVSLLRQKDMPLLQTALDCIVRCGSFSQNQSLLRESGCIQELTLLLQVHAVAARTGVQISQNLLGSINNAVINLCMDIQNQARLEVCIPVLIDLITYEKSPDDVQLMSLKSLTNLSTTPSYHEQYIPVIPRLFAVMDGISASVRIQAVKVLVNLSCNPEIIPDILEAKSPVSLLTCLQPQTDSILLLRVVTLLVNLISCVAEGKLSEDLLPSENKPATPDSMYTFLFGADKSAQLKMRVKDLTRHSTENVSKQAIRLFGYMK